MGLRRMCYACDLKSQDELIETYRTFHRPGGVWPEVIQQIRDTGIADMSIYLTGNRLFMIVEATDKYMKTDKTFDDSLNERVEEWERLMSSFQKASPWAPPGTKWVEMEEIFKLTDH